MDYGIDLSAYNTITDWGAVHGNGITFASIKLTQGNYYASPAAAGQITGGRNAGIAVGGYHFADPNQSAVANADKFAARAAAVGVLAPSSFLPMLDVENDETDGIVWTASAANAFIPNWISEFRAATGVRRVAVYANLSFWQTLLRPAAWADEDVFLWLALYNGDPGDTSPFSHPRLALHQHTSQGVVPGSKGLLDRNVTVGEYRLADLLIGGTMTSPWKEPLTTDDGKQTYPASAFLTNADMHAQAAEKNSADARDNSAATLTAVQSLTKLVQGLAGQISSDQTALLAAISQEENDLLAALKTVTTSSVDPVAVAQALRDAGLGDDVVAALLALLNKAAADNTNASTETGTA